GQRRVGRGINRSLPLRARYHWRSQQKGCRRRDVFETRSAGFYRPNQQVPLGASLHGFGLYCCAFGFSV
ncbi:MAG: hypothetical protein AAGJ35_12940, partial [Myxococcota bacterium]